MKSKKGVIYALIGVSIGYLIYNYLFVDYGYGMMMNHHGYYDSFPRNSYYLNNFLVVISYLTLIVSTIVLLSKKTKQKNYSISILDQRLSSGEISIEDYLNIKSEIGK